MLESRHRLRGAIALAAFLTAAVLFFVGRAAAAAPPSWSLPITVSSVVPAAIGDGPVTVGLPLPRGRFREGADLIVHDGARRLPLQTRVTSRWPDGSVRWLLADWQMSLGPGATNRVRVEPGSTPFQVESSVRVSRHSDRYVIDSGSARFVIPFAGGSLLETVTADGSSPSRLAAFAVVDGIRHEAIGERDVSVVEHGPWRTRVALRFSAGPLRYEIRFDFFAGARAVRVFHSIENHGAAAYAALDELAVIVHPAGTSSDYLFGIEGKSDLRGRIGDAGTSIVQVDAHHLRIGADRRSVRASGWAAVAGGEQVAAVGARFFWQEYPQGIVVQPTAFTYQLRAPTSRALPFGSGAAKTHEFWVLLDGSMREAEALAARTKPLVAWVDPQWTAASGALRNSLAGGDDTAAFLTGLQVAILQYMVTQSREEWDDSGRVTCSDDDANRRVGAFGMLNWGDWNFRGYRDTVKGCDAWGNLEYDTAQVLGLAFAATGAPAHFEAMTAAARHFADVDRIHYSHQHPTWVGMNHPKNPLHFAFELGGVDLGHTWNEGLFTYGLLTGDDRVLRAGKEIADYLVRRRGGGVMFRGNPRQWGWPQIALVAAWEFSGDERYREAALWFAQRGMFAHPADGALDWKRGILAEGLAYTHAVTGDATLLAWLKAYATQVAQARPLDARYYPAMAYMARVVGEKAWAELARERIALLQFGRWGKPLTLAGRIGFATLGGADPQVGR